MHKSMKALLIVAHGSRREASNEEVRRLAALIDDETDEYDIVDCAFLELAQPDIVTGGECLIRQGATEIVAMPYFLVAGRHVVTDVPEEIERLREKHPDIPIRISPYLGAHDAMAELILRQAAAKEPH